MSRVAMELVGSDEAATSPSGRPPASSGSALSAVSSRPRGRDLMEHTLPGE